MTNIGHRQNKQAKGFTKHYESREAKGRIRITNPKHPNYDPKEIDITRLIVKGTLDSLYGHRFLIKRIKIEHPIDKGFFKEVIILNDMGKSLVRRMKRERGII
jgi:hypothetical protein